MTCYFDGQYSWMQPTGTYQPVAGLINAVNGGGTPLTMFDMSGYDQQQQCCPDTVINIYNFNGGGAPGAVGYPGMGQPGMPGMPGYPGQPGFGQLPGTAAPGGFGYPGGYNYGMPGMGGMPGYTPPMAGSMGLDPMMMLQFMMIMFQMMMSQGAYAGGGGGIYDLPPETCPPDPSAPPATQPVAQGNNDLIQIDDLKNYMSNFGNGNDIYTVAELRDAAANATDPLYKQFLGGLADTLERSGQSYIFFDDIEQMALQKGNDRFLAINELPEFAYGNLPPNPNDLRSHVDIQNALNTHSGSPDASYSPAELRKSADAVATSDPQTAAILRKMADVAEAQGKEVTSSDIVALANRDGGDQWIAESEVADGLHALWGTTAPPAQSDTVADRKTHTDVQRALTQHSGSSDQSYSPAELRRTADAVASSDPLLADILRQMATTAESQGREVSSENIARLATRIGNDAHIATSEVDEGLKDIWAHPLPDRNSEGVRSDAQVLSTLNQHSGSTDSIYTAQELRTAANAVRSSDPTMATLLDNMATEAENQNRQVTTADIVALANRDGNDHFLGVTDPAAGLRSIWGITEPTTPAPTGTKTYTDIQQALNQHAGSSDNSYSPAELNRAADAIASSDPTTAAILRQMATTATARGSNQEVTSADIVRLATRVGNDPHIAAGEVDAGLKDLWDHPVARRNGLRTDTEILTALNLHSGSTDQTYTAAELRAAATAVRAQGDATLAQLLETMATTAEAQNKTVSVSDVTNLAKRGDNDAYIANFEINDGLQAIWNTTPPPAAGSGGAGDTVQGGTGNDNPPAETVSYQPTASGGNSDLVKTGDLVQYLNQFSTDSSYSRDEIRRAAASATDPVYKRALNKMADYMELYGRDGITRSDFDAIDASDEYFKPEEVMGLPELSGWSPRTVPATGPVEYIDIIDMLTAHSGSSDNHWDSSEIERAAQAIKDTHPQHYDVLMRLAQIQERAGGSNYITPDILQDLASRNGDRTDLTTRDVMAIYDITGWARPDINSPSQNERVDTPDLINILNAAEASTSGGVQDENYTVAEMTTAAQGLGAGSFARRFLETLIGFMSSNNINTVSADNLVDLAYLDSSDTRIGINEISRLPEVRS